MADCYWNKDNKDTKQKEVSLAGTERVIQWENQS